MKVIKELQSSEFLCYDFRVVSGSRTMVLGLIPTASTMLLLLLLRTVAHCQPFQLLLLQLVWFTVSLTKQKNGELS